MLGTAGQAPTKSRSLGGCALKWDGELVLFDPGEGFQRQCLFGGVAVSRASTLLLTHLHGDHCLGLPGVLQRRILDGAPDRLSVYYPASSQVVFDHLVHSSLFTEVDLVDAHPVEAGPLGSIGELEVTAAWLDHPVPTLGYRLSEPDSTRLDGEHLAADGISGAAVDDLIRTGQVEVFGTTRHLCDYELPRPGQSMAYILDSALCDAAIELAAGVDLLVCEATYLAADQTAARQRGHMTAREAGWLAREAGARRVVLTHFSNRYEDLTPFATEAGELHDDVIVASDLLTVAVPPRRR